MTDEACRRTLLDRLGDGRASGYPDPDICWEWTMARDKDGYGRWSVPGVSNFAHRVVWYLLVGSLTPGLVLDHIECHNPPCVNPSHLREVTPRINSIENSSGFAARMFARYDCEKGHGPLAPHPYKPGTRTCLTCLDERTRRNSKPWRAHTPRTPIKAICKNGHRLVNGLGQPTANLRIRKDGRRECATCGRESQRNRRSA